MRHILITFLATIISTFSFAQNLLLATTNGLDNGGRAIEATVYKGVKCVRVPGVGEGPSSNGVVKTILIDGVVFQNGTIEINLAGSPMEGIEGARGFVGVAFRVQNTETYECLYLRPTNGRADDQVRRNHSAQYISHPDWTWQRLRKESPEKYESYIDLVPGEWTKVKITVSGNTAKLYVHGNTQPTLIVNDLRIDSPGAIALWCEPSTDAYFSDLKITNEQSK